MKLRSLFVFTLILSISLFCSHSFAQSSGIAADKQKQANLEKNRARQIELQKKYNSLTPEQAAEAKRQANAFKRGGYKSQSGKETKNPATKTNSVPAAKSVQPAAPAVKAVQGKAAGSGSQGVSKQKPVMMDAQGKPVNQTTPVNKAGKK